MAKYSDIKGFTVQTVSTDPAASAIDAGSWAAGSAINVGRSYAAGAGSTTAGIIFGGSEPSKSDKTETYNGSSWTEVNEMNTARAQMAPAIRAPYTAALIAGGEEPSISNKVESWDGSSWTEITEINTARRIAGGAGITTSMLVFGGYVGPPAGPPGTTNNTESWNGSAWTEVNEMNSARYTLCGAGATNTAALAFGGSAPPYAALTEEWDGTNWTEKSDLNTGRDEGMSAGIYNAALAIGGLASGAPYITKTENWDGSSWTEISDLATGRAQGLSSAGTNTAAFVAGGNPGNLSSMEIFTAATTFQKQIEGQLFFNSTTNTFKETITDFPGATWASAASMNQRRGRMGFATNVSSTTTHAAFVYGGNEGPGTPGKTKLAEQYDGTSWTEVNDVNSFRGTTGGGGTLTSAAFVGGEIVTSPYNSDAHEQWDGTNWTETTELNTARRSNAGFGATATALLQCAGYTTAAVDLTEQWNGSSWTEVAEQNAAKIARGGTGTVTDGILYGGTDPTTNTETWNGTSWTEVSELNTAGEYRASSGNSTSTDGPEVSMSTVLFSSCIVFLLYV